MIVHHHHALRVHEAAHAHHLQRSMHARRSAQSVAAHVLPLQLQPA